MKNGIRGALLVALGMATGACITAVTAGPAVAPSKHTLPLNEIRQFTDVYGAVKQFYVEPVEDKKLMKEAISGMLVGLDPHSAYLDEDAYKDLQEGTTGEFGGLGIEVGIDPAGVKVISPIDDTPAAIAGIRGGDIIFKIDGKLIRDVPLSDSVKLMRGKPNTAVELSILRKGETNPLTFKLNRAIIKVQSVKSKALPDGMGYIRISQFQERTTSDLAKALLDLEKSGNLKNGLVLDLRNDPGGLLNAAVGVSAAFLPRGSSVVSTRGQVEEAKKEYLAVPQDYQVVPEDKDLERLPESIKTIPLIVLVNGSSASASEIVAGALQDHKRAEIMGTQTFGKGSVQTVIPLRSDTMKTAIKLTTARYFTPSGRSIQAKGITPDIEVKDTAEGNFVDFDIREADLAHHLEVPDQADKNKTSENGSAQQGQIMEKVISDKPDAKATSTKTQSKNAATPQDEKKFYRYGEDDDYQLQQAIKQLKTKGGKPMVTAPVEIQGGIKIRVEPLKK
ncbi:MAG: S41 family peptidase [Burkholderiales bacterium]|nr:S41 family peptidase [Burkholderiales bacterium]